MVSSEEWKKDRLEGMSVTTKYKYSKTLTDIVRESSKPYDTWRSMFEDFKPRSLTYKQWLDNGRNEIIRFWVNTDKVFTKIDYPLIELFPGKEREWAAYRESLLNALQEGYCNDYHYKYLLELDNGTEEDDDKEDGV